MDEIPDALYVTLGGSDLSVREAGGLRTVHLQGAVVGKISHQDLRTQRTQKTSLAKGWAGI